VNEVETNLEDLRDLYIEDLRKIVNYGGIDRTRVAHPGKWRNLKANLTESTKPTVSLDGRKVWAWSDQHFWHKNIIEFSERPYDNCIQMHEHMLANHNEIVGKDDIVIWGGDVGFKGTGVLNEMLAEYNGYKILIVGNHDFNGKKMRKLAFDEHTIQCIISLSLGLIFMDTCMRSRIRFLITQGTLTSTVKCRDISPDHWSKLQKPRICGCWQTKYEK